MRYGAIRGTKGCYAGLTACVQDKNSPIDAPEGYKWFKVICNCFNLEDAKKIANALNNTYKS